MPEEEREPGWWVEPLYRTIIVLCVAISCWYGGRTSGIQEAVKVQKAWAAAQDRQQQFLDRMKADLKQRTIDHDEFMAAWDKLYPEKEPADDDE